MNKIDLRGVFTPQSVAAAFKQLPEMKTSIIDKAFPKAVNHPLPLIGVSEIKKLTGTIPVVRRSSNPITLLGGSAETSFYAPVPLMPAIDIAASELNDLQVLLGDKASKDAWIAGQVDSLRRIVRNTTEAIASVVLTTGKYSWPMRLEGGKFETFEIDFGSPQSITVTKLTASSKLSEVYDILDAMAEAIATEGYGESVKFLAGKKVFGMLLNLAQGWAAASAGANPISVKLEGGVINIGGYMVERMAEKYYAPVSETMVSKVDDNDLLAFGSMSEAGIYYCAIDSISANNKALPFHIYTEQIGDTAIKLQAQSKPVPVRPPKSVCKITII